MVSRSDISKWIVRGAIGLGFGYIATSVLGLHPMVTINFGRPTDPAPAYSGKPYGGDARRGPDRDHDRGYDRDRRRAGDSPADDILRGEARSSGRR
jgi:hypothetical protein